MPYGEEVTFTLDKQEVVDIVALIKRQDPTDKVNQLLFGPVLPKLEKVIGAKKV